MKNYAIDFCYLPGGVLGHSQLAVVGIIDEGGSPGAATAALVFGSKYIPLIKLATNNEIKAVSKTVNGLCIINSYLNRGKET
jgi:hypothetical protein